MTPLLLLVALAAVSPQDAKLVQGFAAAAAGEHGAVDVITSDDVRQAMALEGDRQTLGCDTSGCLAEIAAAMDANIVIYGSVSRLGDEIIAQLTLFDVEKAASHRAISRGATLSALTVDVQAHTRTLVAAAASQLAAGKRLRLIVLDLEAVPEAEPPSPSLPWGAIGAGVVGVGGLVVGGVLDSLAFAENDLIARQPDAASAKSRRDTSDAYAYGAVGGYVLGVVGVGAAVALLLSGGEEPADPQPAAR